MDDDGKPVRFPKPPKQGRKVRSTTSRTNRFSQVSSRLPPSMEIRADSPSNAVEQDLLTAIIGEMTSDIDESQSSTTPAILSARVRLPVPRRSSDPRDRSSKKKGKPNPNQMKTTDHTDHYDAGYDSAHRRTSIGAYRREQLTQHMKEFYQDCFEFDQASILNSASDPQTNNEKRNYYGTRLWYVDQQAFFVSLTPSVCFVEQVFVEKLFQWNRCERRRRSGNRTTRHWSTTEEIPRRILFAIQCCWFRTIRLSRSNAYSTTSPVRISSLSLSRGGEIHARSLRQMGSHFVVVFFSLGIGAVRPTFRSSNKGGKNSLRETLQLSSMAQSLHRGQSFTRHFGTTDVLFPMSHVAPYEHEQSERVAFSTAHTLIDIQ